MWALWPCAASAVAWPGAACCAHAAAARAAGSARRGGARTMGAAAAVGPAELAAIGTSSKRSAPAAPPSQTWTSMMSPRSPCPSPCPPPQGYRSLLIHTTRTSPAEGRRSISTLCSMAPRWSRCRRHSHHRWREMPEQLGPRPLPCHLHGKHTQTTRATFTTTTPRPRRLPGTFHSQAPSFDSSSTARRGGFGMLRASIALKLCTVPYARIVMCDVWCSCR